MRALIVTPAPRHSTRGNRITALRWAAMLRALGHRVAIRERYQGEACELMIALHAQKSAPSVFAFRRSRPTDPVFLALTGTDVYQDIDDSAEANRALELSTRLIVLQARAIERLPAHLQGRARAIIQSARKPKRMERVLSDRFIACVLGHLREVKDPFLTAEAARRLEPESRVAVVHLGDALDEAHARRAAEEASTNPRYHWLKGQPRKRALEILAGSDVLVLTSRLEGGANAVTEAIACGVPVISTRIEGSIGILGADHLGYFPVGDAAALASLLRRAEQDRDFLAQLTERSKALAPLIDPAREREAWASALAEVF